MKRGDICKTNSKVPVVVTHIMKDVCECCRINGNYSRNDLLYIDAEFVKKATVYTVFVSQEFFKKIMKTPHIPFVFETALNKQWDHASVNQYDYLQLCVTKTHQYAYISCEHIRKIRRTIVTETGPGKSITDYAYLHQFKLKGRWKVNTRAILLASR